MKWSGSVNLHEQFMRMALVEAERALGEGNGGFGSVVVRDGEVVATGRNLANSTIDPTAHAETVAIRNAAQALGQLDLSGCILYATFQPCPMCCGAILVSGISTVVLGGRPEPGTGRHGEYTIEKLIEMAGQHNRVEVVTGVLTDECNRVAATVPSVIA